MNIAIKLCSSFINWVEIILFSFSSNNINIRTLSGMGKHFGINPII